MLIFLRPGGQSGLGAQATPSAPTKIYQVDAVSVNPFKQLPANSSLNSMTTIGAAGVQGVQGAPDGQSATTRSKGNISYNRSRL